MAKEAVKGREIVFYRGANSPPILDSINIVVPKGEIYGLLGPSGCGKTTLLRCIVGRLKPKHGTIKVYGKTPGERNSAIPGTGTGYMPQELALYPEMTVEETLRYFGRLYQMDGQEISKRITFLVNLLNLPEEERLVRNLSGGQQRRVSFAAALIHNPPLLILDEPTVGVDPLLRQSIWDHLVTLTRTEHTTIIITTHYVEEARQSHVVGLMRNGRLLAEMNPERLIVKYSVNNLEEAFLQLCQRDNQDTENRTSKDSQIHRSGGGFFGLQNLRAFLAMRTKRKRNASYKRRAIKVSEETKFSAANDVEANGEDDKVARCNGVVSVTAANGGTACNSDTPLASSKNIDPTYEKTTCQSYVATTWRRLYTLLSKNVTQLRRNKPMALFQIVLPFFEMLVFCLCIGESPNNLKTIVVNEENSIIGISNQFLNELDSKTIIQVKSHNLSTALETVRNGKAWGVIYIQPRFTTCIVDRLLEGSNANDETLSCSEIRLYMDMSNQQIAYTMWFTIIRNFQTFAFKLLNRTYHSHKLAEFPIVMQEPIYGPKEPSFIEFVAPGVILAIVSLMTNALTALSIVAEKKRGLLERSLIAGVGHNEIMFSILATQTFLMTAQILLLSTLVFVIYDVPVRGPLFWIIFCIFVAGFNGMALGLVISAICSEEATAMMAVVGNVAPTLLLSGMLWPVESMPTFLRGISYGLPLTLLLNAMRCIMSRGWNIMETQVWTGCLVTHTWTVILLIIAGLVFKLKK